MDDIPQVSQSENEFLTASFTEKEIRDAIFDMEHNKAPSPDGFPAEIFSILGCHQRPDANIS